jgi:CarD family transcriptional regulator
MFKVNDKVCYSTTGMCNVEQICINEALNQKREFYILKPLYDDQATVMVPTENEILTSRMKKPITKKEADLLINEADSITALWYNDDKVRSEEYKKVLISDDRRLLLGVIKALYIHKKSQGEKGRKLRSSDERILRNAEKLFYSELAYVMDISLKEAEEIIINAINI